MRPCSAHSCSRWCRASSAGTSAPPTRRVASCAARPSSNAITGKISSRSRSLTSATKQPRRGSWRSRPSATSTLSASRSGVREMASRSHRAASSRKLPGASAPAKICARSRAAAALCRESGVGRMWRADRPGGGKKQATRSCNGQGPGWDDQGLPLVFRGLTGKPGGAPVAVSATIIIQKYGNRQDCRSISIIFDNYVKRLAKKPQTIVRPCRDPFKQRSISQPLPLPSPSAAYKCRHPADRSALDRRSPCGGGGERAGGPHARGRPSARGEHAQHTPGRSRTANRADGDLHVRDPGILPSSIGYGQMNTHTSHPDIIKRLKRAEGHLKGIIEMLEAERSCLEIAPQLQAVESALGHAKKALVHDHIEHCLEHAIGDNPRDSVQAIREFKEITKYL